MSAAILDIRTGQPFVPSLACAWRPKHGESVWFIDPYDSMEIEARVTGGPVRGEYLLSIGERAFSAGLHEMKPLTGSASRSNPDGAA